MSDQNKPQELLDYELEKQQALEDIKAKKAKKTKIRQRRKSRHWFAATEDHEGE